MDESFEKAYEPAQHEDEIYTLWEQSGFFSPDHLPGDRKESFSMVLPPPNVTGTLHLGHAVMLSVEDIMIRHARLSGKKALWIPGTDHAAIATQAKVEKLLIAEGIHDPKVTLGREGFLEKVRAFAQDSHDTIVNQSKKMGASLDWSREAYTLDAVRAEAVNEAFVRFYESGLLYRGWKVVNWCPRCESTLSDDELNHKETEATLYTFRYNKDIPITISSTRPETKVGDVAIAVSPADERYAALVGREYACEFAGSDIRLQVVADEAVDASFGSGALGVTPAHSKIDEEIAGRHALPLRSVIGEDGRMLNEAGKQVCGMFVQEARAQVVEWLKAENLLEKEESTLQNTPICYRCDTIVESLPKRQWFVDVNKPFAYQKPATHPIEGLEQGQMISLKEIMLHVVDSGQIRIIPDRFEKTYRHWIKNLRDWNVSRQIWFGHRIPAWYNSLTADEHMVVTAKKPEGDSWLQDPDTLDTWFSAGLWTFATLGWPKETEDFAAFHPTQVLETGYDILFFWVARMILMSTFLTGQIPFRDVYLHGLVRDEQGRKMSKSLGNVMDPLDMIAKYGADATRLSLVIGGSPGNDMKLSEEKIAGFRNFTNKLWNISRFILTTVDHVEPVSFVTPRTLADAWILSSFERVHASISRHLEAYEISLAGEVLRDFTWSSFADWYLEIAKEQRLQSEETGTTNQILLYILERLLILWHPFTPYVTEVIWQRFHKDSLLMIQSWPSVTGYVNPSCEEQFQVLQEVVQAIRNIRGTYAVEPKKRLSVLVAGEGAEGLLSSLPELRRLAGVETISLGDGGQEKYATTTVRGMTLRFPLAGLIDVEKERIRLTKAIEEITNESTRLQNQLANTAFLTKAPAQVVEGMQQRLTELTEALPSLQQELDSL